MPVIIGEIVVLAGGRHHLTGRLETQKVRIKPAAKKLSQKLLRIVPCLASSQSFSLFQANRRLF